MRKGAIYLSTIRSTWVNNTKLKYQNQVQKQDNLDTFYTPMLSKLKRDVYIKKTTQTNQKCKEVHCG